VAFVFPAGYPAGKENGKKNKGQFSHEQLLPEIRELFNTEFLCLPGYAAYEA